MNIPLPELTELLDDPPITAADAIIERLSPEASTLDWNDEPRYVRRAVTGRELASRMSTDSRRRYKTVLLLESGLADEEVDEVDHGGAILVACALVEGELGRLLVPPSRVAIGPLLDAVQRYEKVRTVLAAWGEGRCPVTIGLLQHLVLAHRCLLDASPGPHPLSESFDPGYFSRLRERHLERGLGLLRDRWRNPAAHAARTFALVDYRCFVRTLVGRESFEAWHQDGLDAGTLESDFCVFHTHLAAQRAPRGP